MDKAEESMSVEFTRLIWMGASQRVTILVAVEPAPLLRVIEHLFHRQLKFRIVARLSHGSAVAGQVSHLQPDLVIANMRLLGQAAGTIIREIKLASPGSKLIVTGFPRGLGREAHEWGVDAYLEEEDLVRRLVPTAHSLLSQLLQDAKKSFLLPTTKSGTTGSIHARPSKSSPPC